MNRIKPSRLNRTYASPPLEPGRAVAERMFERHKLLTELFTALGVRPETAREDACKIEHDISDETFAAIRSQIKEA